MKRFKNPFKRKTGLDFNRKRGGQRRLNVAPALKIFGCVSGAIVLGVAVSFLFFSGVSMSGTSMSPTLNDGNRVFINRVAMLTSPKVGDVVAFNPDSNYGKNVSIKRIVALPGDTVLIRNGSLYVNGEKEKSNIEIEDMADSGVARNEITLGDGEYFLLGDNRNNSEDSRYESVGNVKKSDIIGLVWLCYSFDNFGPVG